MELGVPEGGVLVMGQNALFKIATKQYLERLGGGGAERFI